jgi:hypothetical protein
MSALRMAELVLNRSKERMAENHAQMDKGCGHDQYMKLVGKNVELKWVQTITREFLAQVEGEDEADDL